MTRNPIERPGASSAHLAAAITRRGSRRTYDIIRWLVDRGRVDDALRAYAYFRWVDDMIDTPTLECPSRVRFAACQRRLLSQLLAGDPPASMSPQEHILADLIAHDTDGHPGLRSYLDKMMAVMEFDAGRCGRTIRAQDLERYSDLLSAAVMDALTYFIGHTTAYSPGPERTLAARAAHVAHMLRDAAEDLPAGYINIPEEILQEQRLAPDDFAHPAYREWVRRRVRLARQAMRAGKRFIASMGNLRARVAGYLYCRQFEGVLQRIERQDFLLSPAGGRRPVGPQAHRIAPVLGRVPTSSRSLRAPSRDPGS